MTSRARSPLEDKIGCLEGQKVQDGQINIELIFFLGLHLSSEGVEACERLTLPSSTARDGASELALQVPHACVLTVLHSQHGEV